MPQLTGMLGRPNGLGLLSRLWNGTQIRHVFNLNVGQHPASRWQSEETVFARCEIKILFRKLNQMAQEPRPSARHGGGPHLEGPRRADTLTSRNMWREKKEKNTLVRSLVHTQRTIHADKQIKNNLQFMEESVGWDEQVVNETDRMCWRLSHPHPLGNCFSHFLLSVTTHPASPFLPSVSLLPETYLHPPRVFLFVEGSVDASMTMTQTNLQS